MKAKLMMLGAVLMLASGVAARADEVTYDYYYPSYPTYPAYPMPAEVDPGVYGSDVPVYVPVIPDYLPIYDPPYPDEGRFERMDQQFHPGYEGWSDYYADPPWRQKDLSNFHPYWMR